MSPAPTKFIFVFVLVINCVLWSHSRYSQFPESRLRSNGSLIKRIHNELLYPNTTYASSSYEKQCRPITFPTPSQCAHVQEACDAPQTFLSINYLQHYFCTAVPLRPITFSALIVWLVFLFSTLGISASDFFTPNLATIAQLLGLDENVAGVTFLAFGNGSPDVFSTFSAMRANSGSLAIGELLGAASFIVSCVVGSMCIIKPFQVSRGPFLRDVGFLTAAVTLLLVILWDGMIRPWEAGVLVALYLFYVAIVVVGSWWERRQESKRRTEALIRSEYQDDEPPLLLEEPYLDDDTPPTPSGSMGLMPPSLPHTRIRAISAPVRPRISTELPPRANSRNRLSSYSYTPSINGHVSRLPSFSLVGALEFRHVVASLQNQAAGSSLSMFESPVTPFAGGRYHVRSISLQRTPRSSLSGDEIRWDGMPLGERSPQPQPHLTFTSAMGSPSDEELGYFGSPRVSRSSVLLAGNHSPTSTAVPSIFRTPASPTASDDAESQDHTPPTKRKRILSVLAQITHTLLPTLQHFRSQSVLGQIASIFAAPAVMLLTLTLPVVVTPYRPAHASFEKIHDGDGRLVDFEEEGEARVLIAEEEVLEDMHEMAFNKWLTAVQCTLGPLFCAGVLFHGTKHEATLLLAAVVGGIATSILVAVFADRGDHPTARMARCSMGFFVAIVWIMAIADEVVNVLQTFGFIFGLSDAIIGLTIFAVGNSLADLVANMSVAVFAPIMGFSACFGGPMLNILLGVGISGTYVIQQTSAPYELYFSTTLFVSTVGLLLLLTATLVFIPLNDYFLTRRWGIFLITCYTIIMTVNVVVELRSGA